ncbi:MAG: CARDB domain-containing protein, partial [Pseudomonas gingeri]
LSTVRDDLDVVAGDGAGNVPEFQNEGNNVATLALPISLATPPDLQVAQVNAPTSVVAGQTLNVDYQVLNAGGATPDDQSNWNDLIYLSLDRFLDINQDRYVGYLSHTGGLAAGASYDGHFSVTAPRDLNGPYYVFVITDPAGAFGSGAYGQVLEFGNDQNNATAAAQPILLQTPPPADLQVSTVSVPAQANVGEPISISYTITNASANTAYGQWTDAVYLSHDNVWGIDDILLGKVSHNGDLAGNASYSASLTALLPPLKDGSWRIIVRPDLYNEVFEGEISYGAQGLVMAPGEANNLTASAATVQTSVPALVLASPTPVMLSPDKPLLYKVSVAAGQTLRVLLDSTAAEGDNELYIRYGDIPTTYAYDAAYSDASAADQQALIASTQAGDYYILVRARSGDATPVNLRADLLPLSITRVTPDNGGVGDSDHRWVTLDIYGASFQAGALVKLSRPGVYEAEPERWQVLDATHIRAIFDTSTFPLGLYDVSVTNPDGRSVTEANRYMVERGIEDDVTIGIGGPRDLQPGDSATYTVSLQSLTNVDTPYVYFNIGAVQMGYNQYLLDGLHLPYALFGASVTGNPFGDSSNSAANNQAYGQTVATQSRSDIPWSSLDGTLDTNGFNLAPGYALDVAAHGTVGMTFRLQTYPGLSEWLNRDFIGLRDALYATHQDWKAQGLLDGGVADLDKIAKGLTATFLAPDPENRISKLALLSESFQMNVVATATAMTRDEFISQQTRYALSLRTAVLADSSAPSNLAVLAADADQWVNGWLAALQSAGLLLPAGQAPVIVATPQVVSLNATLAAGILLSKGGDNYRTQADILGFFQKVQQWYGDTAQYSGDPNAAVAPIDHYEVRSDKQGNEVLVPVSKLADAADYDLHLGRTLQFENFIVFVGATSELEY